MYLLPLKSCAHYKAPFEVPGFRGVNWFGPNACFSASVTECLDERVGLIQGFSHYSAAPKKSGMRFGYRPLE